MKFENIIIGAGLAGVTAGIKLAEEGKSVALVSAGRSSMHFNSGSLGLLGFDRDHQPVISPFDIASSLPSEHPYKKLGVGGLVDMADGAADLLRRAGVKTIGNGRENHMRVSPLGVLRPAWLTFDNLVTIDALKRLERPHVAIVGIAGFLDFYPRFIAASLEKEGFKCDLLTVDNDDLRRLRKSETEMRAANIARIMEGDALTRFAESVRDVAKKSDDAALILPPVVNFDGEGESLHLR
ncbi:MAG: FAD-binding protein, partial [Muribaculaceae bacterium]|nr:FAD-binding protein [Muribaculaceae bacterium]